MEDTAPLANLQSTGLATLSDLTRCKLKVQGTEQKALFANTDKTVQNTGYRDRWRIPQYGL